MASLCKTGRLWWSLPDCVGKVLQCCGSLGRLCGLSEVLWASWVPSDAPGWWHPRTCSGLQPFAVTRDRQQGPACGMALAGLSRLFVRWLCGNCLTSSSLHGLFFAFGVHIKHEQSYVSRSQLQSAEGVQSTFTDPESSRGCPRKCDKGLYPDTSPAPLLWSGCLFLLHPFNDIRCNQEAAETQLHNWLSGFLFGSIDLCAVCMLAFRNLGIFC